MKLPLSSSSTGTAKTAGGDACYYAFLSEKNSGWKIAVLQGVFEFCGVFSMVFRGEVVVNCVVRCGV
jgi:hypothetical protein